MRLWFFFVSGLPLQVTAKLLHFKIATLQ